MKHQLLWDYLNWLGSSQTAYAELSAGPLGCTDSGGIQVMYHFVIDTAVHISAFREGIKRGSQVLHSDAWRGDLRRWAWVERRGVRNGSKEKLFLYNDIPAMAQAAQRGCAISVLWGFQVSSGSSPGQPGLTLELPLLWGGGWTRNLLRSLPAWVILILWGQM